MRSAKFLSGAGVAVTALLLSLSAQAAFTGYFAVPDVSGDYTATIAGVAVGNWILQANADGAATLARLPHEGDPGNPPSDQDASTATLSVLAGGYGYFGITNGDTTAYSLGFNWSTSFSDAIGYIAEYWYQEGWHALSGGGGQVTGVVLPIGDTLAFRITTLPGAFSENLAISMHSIIQAVPEPSAAILALLGLSGCSLLRRRRS